MLPEKISKNPYAQDLTKSLISRLNDQLEFDGQIIGANGCPHPSKTPLHSIIPITPCNGEEIREHIYQVNGVMTDLRCFIGDLQMVSDSGASVIGIYNASSGLLGDLAEIAGEKLEIVDSKPALTVARLIREHLATSTPLHLLGHSQGALILGRALDIIKTERLEFGQSIEEIEAAFSSIKIETYGGIKTSWPDGPQYLHIYNLYDPVPQLLGLGLIPEKMGGRANPGRGAVVKTFAEVCLNWPVLTDDTPEVSGSFFDRMLHGQRTIYFSKRIPFSEARRLYRES